jgi:hypothetical protein
MVANKSRTRKSHLCPSLTKKKTPSLSQLKASSKLLKRSRNSTNLKTQLYSHKMLGSSKKQSPMLKRKSNNLMRERDSSTNPNQSILILKKLEIPLNHSLISWTLLPNSKLTKRIIPSNLFWNRTQLKLLQLLLNNTSLASNLTKSLAKIILK